MNRVQRLIAIPLGLVAGCVEAAAATDCLAELQRQPVAEQISVDLRELAAVDILRAESFWDDLTAIDTACPLPPALPDEASYPSASRRKVKAVGHVRLEGIRGVLFAYGSRGPEEVMTGVAVAVVEFGPDGKVRRIYKASELLQDEGWARLTTSTLTATSIIRCAQELEYFMYSDDGDVVGTLETPAHGPRSCESIMSPRSNPGNI